MNKQIEVILFDLGGVLVELVGMSTLLKWMNNTIEPSQLNEKWLLSQSVRDFERGRTSVDEFSDSIIKEFHFPVSSQEFLLMFNQFINGFYQGADKLIQTLSQNYTIATLSNTNPIHWKKMCDEDQLEKIIPYHFPSFKTGFVKPDKEAFLNVIESLNCNPAKILFFDDNQLNVDAAVRTGINAVKVIGFDDLNFKLKKLDIL